MTINLYNTDCMQALREMSDNQYDLAIVDPPYGIGINKSGRLGKYGGKKDWDSHRPSREYFDELCRVSTNQVIWGGNYFSLPSTPCFLIWDKKQPQNLSFAQCEYAWTSFKTSAKIFVYRPHLIKNRIHPTQKPVRLYEWILERYANTGDTILDTHLGSGSIALACHNTGHSLDAYEIDAEYFASASARLHEHQRQIRLFT